MSTSNLCTTANYDVSKSKASVQKEVQALQQTINLQSQTSPTILITNYSHNNAIVKNASRKTHSTTNKLNSNGGSSSSSSITIYTHNNTNDSDSPANLPAPSINIHINNHFERPLVESVSTTSKNDGMHAPLMAIKIEKTEKDVVDSAATGAAASAAAAAAEATIHTVSDAGTSNGWISRKFSVDNDVLVKRCDGRIYLGTIVKVDSTKCLVKYDDNSLRWSDFEHITTLDSFEDESKPMCIVCKDDSDVDEMVHVCGVCCRSYHEKCMNGKIRKTGDWHCARCITDASKISFNVKEERLIVDKPKLPKLGTSAGNQLPYDLNELSWDTHHRQNEQQTYCYCGKKGKWYMQMLQCTRCLQWFHAKCVKCLNYPLYFGDRFYLFACANCNHGVEFLRRLHMTIEDVVHLMMFNLSLHHSRSYYDLSNVIYPYIKDNWHALQLPPKLKNMMSNDVKDETAKALRSHMKRFKPGREVKQKVLSWALKVRAPPKASHIALPPGPILTEKYINDLFCDQARIHYLPQNINSTESVANDAKMRALMCGKNYAQFIENCETSSGSDIDSGENVLTSASDEEFLADLVQRDPHQQRHVDLNDCDNSLTGYETIMAKGKKRLSGGSGCIEPKKRGRPPKTSDRRSDFLIEFGDSSDDTSSRGTLDSIIPPPKDFSGSNNPFLIDNSNSSNSLLNASTNQSTSIMNGLSGLNFTNSITKGAANQNGGDKNQIRIVRTVKRRLSARDILIGPNMEIKRRKLKKRSDENVEVISTTTLLDLPKSASYLPIRGDSKDISITALRSSLGASSSTSKTTSTPECATVTNENNANGRRLRQRQDKSSTTNVQKSKMPQNEILSSELSLLPQASNSLAFGNCSIPGSPIKGNVTETLNDLHTSLNMYFGGVANRIANGESFVIRGKRVSLDGRLQYLIEWEGVS